MTNQDAYLWKKEGAAEEILLGYLNHAVVAQQSLAGLREELYSRSSIRLFDIVDHFVIGHSEQEVKRLLETGFVEDEKTEEGRAFHHPGAQLPRVVIRPTNGQPKITGVAVKTESISDFLMVRGKTAHIEGSPLSGYRRCCLSIENGLALWVVERRGSRSYTPISHNNHYVDRYIEALEKWRTRPRDWEDEEQALNQAQIRAREMVATMGQDTAAWIVCEVERAYWEAKNRAGQLQKDRQDQVGIGWANHDHHTFRSSRRLFQPLVALFEILGFHCRERFYAGEEAGWGAQVMENSSAGLILFLDVDLSPEEIAIDFAHQPLEPLQELGTIGLWCALHGDSICQSGMHHLEGQFEFEQLTEDLATVGVGMMDPFSNYPHLKQAFTAGEMWAVSPRRIRRLLKEGLITNDEAEAFLNEGAVGSHLENLQRREGFKGFNQKNVSFIIKKTDPRQLHSDTK